MVQINNDDMQAVIKRLNRAQGQIAGIVRMIEQGRECDEIVTQISAVNKAVSRAGFAVISSGLEQCYNNKSKGIDIDVAKLEKLFLSLA